MQKIVILADRVVAKPFLKRVSSEHFGEIHYDIVCQDMSILPSGIENIATVHNFDPTNEYKLNKIISKDIAQVFVLLDHHEDIAVAIKVVRDMNEYVQIFALKNDQISKLCEEFKVKTIDVEKTVSAMLVNFLPTVPLIASNIGQGNGEIMQVLVPYGSKYVFRHISNIEQKNWRIVSIYREGKLILPKPSTMIFPNDELLLVGKPDILKDIYKSIKSELGQFPQPFGSNIYMIADVQKLGLNKLMQFVEDLKYLSAKLKNKKLIIKALNMTNPEQGEYLRSIISDTIIVDMDFFGSNVREKLREDIKRYNVGLIALSAKEFAKNDIKRILFELKKPVIKLSSKSIQDAKESIILLHDEKHIEQISNVFFDVAILLDSQTVIADFDPSGKNKDDLYEHFTNLANIYTKKLKIEKDTKNPIRELKKRENFIQFLPFEESMTQHSIFDFFTPKSNPLFGLLDENTQILIPTTEHA